MTGLPPRTRRRRGIPVVLAVPAVSILVLVLGWTALWFFARQEAMRVLDRLIAREHGQGRDWACPGRKVRGFPLRIVLTCVAPSFEGKLEGTDVSARVERLRAEALLYLPSAITVSAEGPLRASVADGRADITLAWSTLRTTLRGLPGDLKRGLLELDDPGLTAGDGLDGTAKRFELHVGPAPGRPLAERALDLHLVVVGAAVPALDGVTGSNDPADLDVSAVATQAWPTAIEPGTATVEAWRAAGGTVELGSGTLIQGPLRATATGSLRLDAAHRPAGRLRMGLTGFEATAERLGIPPRALAIGGALAGILGRPNGADAPPKGVDAPNGDPAPAALRLPVVLEEGRVEIGPFRTAVRLRPLY